MILKAMKVLGILLILMSALIMIVHPIIGLIGVAFGAFAIWRGSERGQQAAENVAKKVEQQQEKQAQAELRELGKLTEEEIEAKAQEVAETIKTGKQLNQLQDRSQREEDKAMEYEADEKAKQAIAAYDKAEIYNRAHEIASNKVVGYVINDVVESKLYKTREEGEKHAGEDDEVVEATLEDYADEDFYQEQQREKESDE